MHRHAQAAGKWNQEVVAENSFAIEYRRLPGVRNNNMEPTITQNNSLYLVQHRLLEERRSFFHLSRKAARRQKPEIRRVMTFGEAAAAALVRPGPDNGR